MQIFTLGNCVYDTANPRLYNQCILSQYGGGGGGSAYSLPPLTVGSCVYDVNNIEAYYACIQSVYGGGGFPTATNNGGAPQTPSSAVATVVSTVDGPRGGPSTLTTLITRSSGGQISAATGGSSVQDTTGGSESGGTNTGAIVGGVVGGIVALAAIGALLWFFARHQRKKGREEAAAAAAASSGAAGPAVLPDGAQVHGEKPGWVTADVTGATAQGGGVYQGPVEWKHELDGKSTSPAPGSIGGVFAVGTGGSGSGGGGEHKSGVMSVQTSVVEIGQGDRDMSELPVDERDELQRRRRAAELAGSDVVEMGMSEREELDLRRRLAGQSGGG